MMQSLTSSLRFDRAPVLAVAAIALLALSPNTLASAKNTIGDVAPKHFAVSKITSENGQVLNQDDASLYRSIFVAQQNGYWKEADLMMAHLSDRRLMGHILADRYQRRGATLTELQGWMAAYHDLPQTNELYDQARKLPGGLKAKIIRPTGNLAGGHGYSYATGTGFRQQKSQPITLTVNARKAAAKIEMAMHQGKPEMAKILLEATVQQKTLPPEKLVALQSRLAAGYFYNGDGEEARKLTEVSYMQNDARAMWISGLSNYKAGNYKAAAAAFKTLAGRDDLNNSDQAAASFWAYRAIKMTNKHADEADQWLAQAANAPHSFYGLLASTLRGDNAEDEWSWRLPEFNKHTADILASQTTGARALALMQIGQRDMAENELRRMNTQGRRPLQEALLAYAEKEHMPSLALQMGGIALDGDGKPYDAALYPLPPWQPKDGYRVERALMYALMRHESQFDPTVISSQGACGLMQLMPATAAYMSGTHKHAGNSECPDQFFDPVTNVSLGQSYVRQLSDQPMIGDNLLLLLAAYNGGPGRLSQRSGIDASADPLLFMEGLPSQETHDYVQQVLIQYWTYRARLKQPLKSLDQMARGQWPRFALRDQPTLEAELNVKSQISLASK